MFSLKFELFFDSYAESHHSFCIYLRDLLSAFPTIQIMNLISHKAFQQPEVKVYFQSTLSAVTGNIHSTAQLGNWNWSFLLTSIYFLPTNKKQTRIPSPSFFNKGLHPRHCFKPQGVKRNEQRKKYICSWNYFQHTALLQLQCVVTALEGTNSSAIWLQNHITLICLKWFPNWRAKHFCSPSAVGNKNSATVGAHLLPRELPKAGVRIAKIRRQPSQRTFVAISKLYRHPGLIKDCYHQY